MNKLITWDLGCGNQFISIITIQDGKTTIMMYHLVKTDGFSILTDSFSLYLISGQFCYVAKDYEKPISLVFVYMIIGLCNIYMYEFLGKRSIFCYGKLWKESLKIKYLSYPAVMLFFDMFTTQILDGQTC